MNASAPIVRGIHGCRGSRLAARTARALSEQLRAPLVLLHILPPPQSGELGGAPAEHITERGHAADRLCAAASRGA